MCEHICESVEMAGMHEITLLACVRFQRTKMSIQSTLWNRIVCLSGRTREPSRRHVGVSILLCFHFCMLIERVNDFCCAFLSGFLFGSFLSGPIEAGMWCGWRVESIKAERIRMGVRLSMSEMRIRIGRSPLPHLNNRHSVRWAVNTKSAINISVGRILKTAHVRWI